MRVVIANKEKGAFLGNYANFPVFSNIEDYGAYRIPTFKDEKTAKKYVDQYLKEDFEFIKVNSEDEYISCIDLIKEGHHDICGSMINNLPLISDTLH